MTVKRMFDLTGAVLGLVLLWPVAVIVAIAIKLESEGPVVFSQTRVGRGERLFRCHKFRSMHTHVPERPTHEAAAGDVTRVGRVLRSSKLDELPQLINVLLGDMSLVGPRPCLPSQTHLIDVRRKLGVHRVLPGITGLAQVNGVDMSDPERLARVDATYVANATALMDVRLVLASLPGGRRLAPEITIT